MYRNISLAVLAVGFAAVFCDLKAQEPVSQPVCDPVPCNDTSCMSPVPCTTEQGDTAQCYTPDYGCDFTSCYYPSMIDRYAYLANKYNTLGPADRQAAIANNNQEVIELQKLDNKFAASSVRNNLTTEQLLKLQAAQGSIRR